MQVGVRYSPPPLREMAGGLTLGLAVKSNKPKNMDKYKASGPSPDGFPPFCSLTPHRSKFAKSHWGEPINRAMSTGEQIARSMNKSSEIPGRKIPEGRKGNAHPLSPTLLFLSSLSISLPPALSFLSSLQSSTPCLWVLEIGLFMFFGASEVAQSPLSVICSPSSPLEDPRVYIWEIECNRRLSFGSWLIAIVYLPAFTGKPRLWNITRNLHLLPKPFVLGTCLCTQTLSLQTRNPRVVLNPYMYFHWLID